MLDSGVTLKDHFRETQMFNVRAVIVLVFCLGLVLILIMRLFLLQVLDHDIYTTLSENNRFHISAVPPTRGLIYDANGVILAQNLPTYALVLVPERVANIKATIKSLQELITITDSDIDNFYKAKKNSRGFKSIPLRTRLSDEEVARIAVNRHRYPGVDINARLERHYAHGQLAAHVIGYVGRINEREWGRIDQSDYDGTNYIGKTGVEKFYEDRLHGHVGIQQIETNAAGRTLRSINQVPAESGHHLHLTLDASLQAVAELALEEIGHNGAVVAINPVDGGVLALASVPTFDPNLFVNGIDKKTYKLLRNDENKPLFNRAMQGRYPPGSTVKPFIALAGLEKGVMKKEDTTFCRGWFRLRGSKHKYRDWKKTGHGEMDLNHAVIQSCDVYFYDLALSLGIERMASFMKSFGFNSRTGVDISGEGSGLWPTEAWKRRAKQEPWYPGETLIAGIGQGYTLITPLQLAASTATISRFGIKMQPRIVDSIENSTTHEKQTIFPIQDTPTPVVDRANWDAIHTAMINVVHHWRGTARRIGKDSAYKIAGKTGTAQVFSVKQDEEYDEDKIDKKLQDHALFIAYAPADDPKIAVAVIVENGGHGGSVAAPIARKVMDYYLLPRLHEQKEKQEQENKQKAKEAAANTAS